MGLNQRTPAPIRRYDRVPHIDGDWCVFCGGEMVAKVVCEKSARILQGILEKNEIARFGLELAR